jgi:hypothetical protein
VERLQQHPQSPSAKWAKFHADIAEAAVKSAEERAAADRKEKAGTDYSRRIRNEPTKG